VKEHVIAALLWRDKAEAAVFDQALDLASTHLRPLFSGLGDRAECMVASRGPGRDNTLR